MVKGMFIDFQRFTWQPNSKIGKPDDEKDSPPVVEDCNLRLVGRAAAAAGLHLVFSDRTRRQKVGARRALADTLTGSSCHGGKSDASSANDARDGEPGCGGLCRPGRGARRSDA